MNRIENQTLENVVVNFDGYQYYRCTFNRCQLLFTGMAPPQLIECQIRSDCAWSFGGPAQNTLSFLSELYKLNAAGKALVESVIQSIRNGPPHQPVPAPQPDEPKGSVH